MQQPQQPVSDQTQQAYPAQQPYPTQQQQLPLYNPNPVLVQYQGNMHANGMMYPSTVTCQHCQKTGVTRMTKSTCNLHTCLWCWFCCLWCCFVPGCCTNQTKFKHYCQNCGAEVGVKESQCC